MIENGKTLSEYYQVAKPLIITLVVQSIRKESELVYSHSNISSNSLRASKKFIQTMFPRIFRGIGTFRRGN